MSFNACMTLDPPACLEATTTFVSRALGDVLNGRKIEQENPPPLDLTCRHTSAVSCIAFGQSIRFHISSLV